jgi:hypothetical protein
MHVNGRDSSDLPENGGRANVARLSGAGGANLAP